MDPNPQVTTHTKSDLLSDTWKSNLEFTGNNPVFPVEMFIALMEKSKKREIQDNDDSCFVKKVLNQIPHPTTSAAQNISQSVCPGAIWKKKHGERLSKLDWNGLKQELLDNFGQKQKYSINDKLNFLCSFKIGSSEDSEDYLIRINMIVSYIEHGKICDKPPNSVWVQLLYILGTSSQDKHFLFDGCKTEGYNKNTPPDVLGNGLDLADDIQKFELFEGHEESGTSDGINDDIYGQMCQNDECYDKQIKENDSNLQLNIVLKQEDNDDSNAVKQPKDLNERGKSCNIRFCPDKEESQAAYNVANEAKEDEKVSILSSNDPDKYDIMPPGRSPVKGKTNKVLHYCGICNKQMKSLSDLRSHCIDDHEGKRFKCDNCNFTSKAPHELARHLLRMHHMETEGYEVFRCNYPSCEYKCIEKHKFQTHIDGVHKGLRTFKCNACDKSFGQKGTLKLHVQGVHMGLRYVN